MSVLRPPDSGPPKYHGAHTSLPASKFGPGLSGPADHPDIIARQKQMEEDAAKPGLIKRGWNAITGSGSSTTATTKTKNEVTRTTKDGRQAVFDAETKKFLRYAD